MVIKFSGIVLLTGLLLSYPTFAQNQVLWEYDFVYWSLARNADIEKVVQPAANKKGRKGWEMVGTVPYKMGVLITYKRKLK